MNTRVKSDTYRINSCVTAMSSIRHNFGKMKVECKPGVIEGIFLPQSWTLKNRSDVKFSCGNCSILFSYVLQIEDSGIEIWLSDYVHILPFWKNRIQFSAPISMNFNCHEFQLLGDSISLATLGTWYTDPHRSRHTYKF